MDVFAPRSGKTNQLGKELLKVVDMRKVNSSCLSTLSDTINDA